MFIMRKYEILGFFIIALISVVLAIISWLVPSNFIIDGLAPTSDSLWQVGKLMFISILFYSLIEYNAFGKNFDNFVFAKSAAMFVAPLMYIGISYLIDRGMSNATFNSHILSYAIALGLGQYLSYFIMRDGYYFNLMNAYALIATIVMLCIYIGYGSITDKFDAPIYKSLNGGYQEHIIYLE